MQNELNEEEREFLEWRRAAPRLYTAFVAHVLEQPTAACALIAAENTESERRRTLAIVGRVGNASAIVRGELRIPQTNNCFSFEKGIAQTAEITALRAWRGQLASCATDGSVTAFSVDGHFRDLFLGHERDCSALAWRGDGGALSVVALDGRLVVWDTNSPEQPLLTHIFRRPLYATCFHARDRQLLVAGGEDCSLSFFDLRRPPTPIMEVAAHTRELLSADFAPQNDFLLLSAGADGRVRLWDLRRLDEELHAFAGHSEAVAVVAWSAHNAARFASAGADGRVCVWSCARIGAEERSPGDEVVFRHGGHRGAVRDLQWDLTSEDALISCDDGGQLHFWEIAPTAFRSD